VLGFIPLEAVILAGVALLVVLTVAIVRERRKRTPDDDGS
jgi:hypothetical protein